MEIYVDSLRGHDSACGNINRPVKTLYRASILAQSNKNIKSIHVEPGCGYLINTSIITQCNWYFAKGTRINIGTGGTYADKCGSLSGKNIRGYGDFVLNNCYSLNVSRKFRFNSIVGQPLAPVFEIGPTSYCKSIRGNLLRITKGAILFWNQHVPTSKIHIRIYNMEADLLYLEEISAKIPRPVIKWEGYTLILHAPSITSHLQATHSQILININTIQCSTGPFILRLNRDVDIKFRNVEMDHLLIRKLNQGYLKLYEVRSHKIETEESLTLIYLDTNSIITSISPNIKLIIN